MSSEWLRIVVRSLDEEKPVGTIYHACFSVSAQPKLRQGCGSYPAAWLLIKIGVLGICYSGSCCKLIISGYGRTGIQALGEAFPDEGTMETQEPGGCGPAKPKG